MVVDTSALFAIEFLEPEAERMHTALRSAEAPVISAATSVELMVALSRRRHSDQQYAVEHLLDAYAIEIVAVDAGQVRAAWSGFARFGRGSRHPAHLNFGDCFSYALARSRNMPLLFKGGDFGRTDVLVAPW